MKKIMVGLLLLTVVVGLLFKSGPVEAFWPFDRLKSQGSVMGETTTNTTDVLAINEYLGIINEACDNISSSQTEWQPFGTSGITEAANARRLRQEMNTLTNSVSSKCKDIKKLSDKIVALAKKLGFDITPSESASSENLVTPTPTKTTSTGNCKKGVDGTCCERGYCNSNGTCMWTCCTRTSMVMAGGSKQGNSKCVSSFYEEGETPLVD